MKRDLSPTGDWNHGTTIVHGTRLHYVREGMGHPVILLHGWPEFWWTWHRNIPVLAAYCDVIAPDFRGFGDTPRQGSEEFGPDDHAADILTLANALGLERFGLVSHDVGAYVAQSIARLAPDRVSGLFFFNGPHPGIGKRWVDADHVREIWYQSFQQLPWAAALVGHSPETCRLYFEGILRHWCRTPAALEDLIDPFIANFQRPDAIAGGFAWYRATHAARMALIRDGAPPLAKIAIPSRFFWGQHDPVIRSDWADTLPDYFTNPEIEIAEAAGHFVHFEQPDAANQRIIRFFKQCDWSKGGIFA